MTNPVLTQSTAVQRGQHWLYLLLFYIGLGLLILSVSRAALMLWQYERVIPTGGIGFMLLQGIRFDLITLGLLFVFPFAFTPLLLAVFPKISKFLIALLKWYVWLVLGLLLYMELATPQFINEFDLRPNYLFVEYLKYPKEVLSMLLKAYPLSIVFGLSVFVGIMLMIKRVLTVQTSKVSALLGFKWYTAIPVLFITLVIGVLTIRSTLGHRPINPSIAAFSPDPLMNTLALNSTYSVLYAIYEKTYEKGFAYPSMPEAEVMRVMRDEIGLSPEAFNEPGIPTYHLQENTLEISNPKNLVIVLEESLGAEFVGRMGGVGVTPNIDALSREGIWFENLYATGTRSVRGIEAVISGFLPTASPSVVKLSKSQHNFFTIAELLKREGYKTSFIYGGESHFDNMRRFFSNNGFDAMVDQNDYIDPEFVSSWGVSDEDLFDNANEYLSAQYDNGEPFFSLIFTSSNHSPFEIPEGKIERVEAGDTVNNAVKYADFALGEYIADAKQSNYWDDTVFLVISDHNSRVYGDELVPIERFHVPAFILGGGIEPIEIETLASQIDMIPTLLDLIGLELKHPGVGVNLLSLENEASVGRSVMQFGDNFAYREHDRVVILQKHKSPQLYLYKDNKLVMSTIQDLELVEKAIAYANWPVIEYNKGLYHLPDEE